MLDKIKALPEKKTLLIGLFLIICSPLILFLLSLLIQFNSWVTMIAQALIWGLAILFILSAADKKQSRIDME